MIPRYLFFFRVGLEKDSLQDQYVTHTKFNHKTTSHIFFIQKHLLVNSWYKLYCLKSQIVLYFGRNRLYIMRMRIYDSAKENFRNMSMPDEIKEMFESCSREYITPHYWAFLSKLVERYLELNTPHLSVLALVDSIGSTRMTYYRFVKRFYSSTGTFWDLMERARAMNNAKVRQQVHHEVGRASSGSSF